MRALQAFTRLQDEPPGAFSLGDAAAEAVALVDLVLPTHNVTLTATGDATVIAAPGEVRCSLVELLVDALERSDSRGEIALTVRSEGPTRSSRRPAAASSGCLPPRSWLEQDPRRR